MNWDDLKLFLETVRAGDYSSAGKALGMDRTTIGRRVQRLEREIGGDIWERGQDGERPSSRGAAILEAARRMEDACDALQTALGADTPSRAIRIAGALELEQLLLPEIAAAQAEASIRVELVGLPDPVLALQKRQADLGLAFVTAPPAELDGVAIARLEPAFFAHWQASDARIGWTATALMAQPQPWTRANTLRPAQAALEVGSFPALHTALLTGLGGAWTWEALVREHTELERRPGPESEPVPASAQLWLLNRETTGLSPAMRRFAEQLSTLLKARLAI